MSMALLEHSIMDARNGRVINANFADYAVPAHADVRAVMDVVFVEEHDLRVNQLGGLERKRGRDRMVGLAPDILSALLHARGRRIRNLVPGHCDPTVNLYDWIVGVRDGGLECLWPAPPATTRI